MRFSIVSIMHFSIASTYDSDCKPRSTQLWWWRCEKLSRRSWTSYFVSPWILDQVADAELCSTYVLRPSRDIYSEDAELMHSFSVQFWLAYGEWLKFVALNGTYERKHGIYTLDLKYLIPSVIALLYPGSEAFLQCQDFSVVQKSICKANDASA